MAEIQVERRKRSGMGRAIIALVVVVLLGAGWFFTMGPGATSGDLGPATPGAETPAPAPNNGAGPATPGAPPAQIP
jgi:hypothetical protein